MLTCPKQSFMGETSVTARSRNNYVWVNGNVSHVPPWIPPIINVDTWCLTRIAPSAKYPATIVRAGTSTMSCKKHKVGFKLLCSESTCPLFDVYVPITKPYLSSSFSYLRRVQDLNYHWILLTNYVDRNPDPHAIHWFIIIFPMKMPFFVVPTEPVHALRSCGPRLQAKSATCNAEAPEEVGSATGTCEGGVPKKKHGWIRLYRHNLYIPVLSHGHDLDGYHMVPLFWENPNWESFVLVQCKKN